MPVCDNRLLVTGDSRLLEFFIKKAEGKPAKYDLSDEERSAYEEVGELEGVLADLPIQAIACNALVPVPPEILQAGYSNAGCDWQLRYWGIRWELLNTKLEVNADYLSYRFDTAECPPTNFIDTVAEQYPNLSFELVTLDVSAGLKYHTVWKNGRQALDDTTDISENDLKEFEIEPTS